jgi:3-methylcrotonyl-CoA carboxylase alpha subunit
VEAARAGRRNLGITAGGEESTVEVVYSGDGLLRATIDGRPVEARVLLSGAEIRLTLGDETYVLRKASPPTVDSAGPAADAAASLTAPMPGTVVKVLVELGEEVEEGRLLLVLEAMKMEQPVSAPYAGVVRSIPSARDRSSPEAPCSPSRTRLDQTPRQPAVSAATRHA